MSNFQTETYYKSQELLTEMSKLVREDKKVCQLTFDDCLPHLFNVYQSMASINQRTREVPISEILANLVNEKVTYRCDIENELAYHICGRLGDYKIPCEALLGEYNAKTGKVSAKGVVLKLYR